jgi:hypothetical protein
MRVSAEAIYIQYFCVNPPIAHHRGQGKQSQGHIGMGAPSIYIGIWDKQDLHFKLPPFSDLDSCFPHRSIRLTSEF